MTIIKLDDYIDNISSIIDKKVNQLNISNIISVVIHSFRVFSKDITNIDRKKWEEYYEEFVKTFDKQNDLKWPQFVSNHNYEGNRINIYSVDISPIKSDNGLFLLTYLLYVEKSKYSSRVPNTQYVKILDHIIAPSNKMHIKNIKMSDLYDILESCIKYYLKIYSEQDLIENKLGREILLSIEN
jgi:hypothetical protein